MEEQANNINNKLDKIIDRLNEVTQQVEQLDTEDGKVTFTYSANDRMVAVLPNLNLIMSSLEDLQNYRRELYKYDVKGEIYFNKETKEVKELDNMTLDDTLGEGFTTYIKVQDVIDKIDYILDGIYTILDKYWY